METCGGRRATIFLLVLILIWMQENVGGASSSDKSSPVTTFTLENGDIIDCIDIYKQPTFDDPRFKDHKILMKPSYIPRNIVQEEKVGEQQFLHADLDSVECPTGTVPIKKTNKEEPRKSLIMPSSSGESDPSKGVYLSSRATQLATYYGGTAAFTIHSIQDIVPKQMSGAHIRLSSQPSQNEYIVFGWMAFHDLYNDYQPRLTLYWDVKGKACFNTECPGFVVTSPKHYLGGKFSNISVVGGPQFEITVAVFKDPAHQIWWVTFGEDQQPIGYWGHGVLNTLEESATRVMMGGYVFTPPFVNSPSMGSGKWPRLGPGGMWSRLRPNFWVGTKQDGAAAVSKIRIVLKNDSAIIPDPPDFDFWTLTDNRFYGLGGIKTQGPLELHFYYGGPGGSHVIY